MFEHGGDTHSFRPSTGTSEVPRSLQREVGLAARGGTRDYCVVTGGGGQMMSGEAAVTMPPVPVEQVEMQVSVAVSQM